MSEVKEIANDFFGLENNKVTKTIIHLTKFPGKTIRDYCVNQNKNYLRPFSYLFAVIGIYVFFQSVFPNPYEEKKNKQKEVEYNEKINKIDKTHPQYTFEVKFHRFQLALDKFLRGQYGAYALAFLMTLMHLLVFKNLRESLKNNVWFTIFVFAQTSLFQFFLGLPLYFSTNSKFMLIGFSVVYTITISYRIWACKQFYAISWKRAILKNIFMYLLIGLLLVISMILVVVALIMSVKASI